VNPSLLPLLIFVAEVCVVTISTVRIIFLSRRQKFLAMLLGVFEVSIWLFAIGKVMQNLSDPFCFIAFAGGFAIGNYLGVVIEQKLAIGNLVVRVITHKNGEDIVASLKAANYGVTSLDAQGTKGPVLVILTVIPRKELGKVVGLLKTCDENVFYSVDDLQSASAGVFPDGRERVRMLLPSLLRWPWPARLRSLQFAGLHGNSRAGRNPVQ
jgi:uncharacterized protein YebE (UPF0316 family)